MIKVINELNENFIFFNDKTIEGETIDPFQLLHYFVLKKIKWRISYKEATECETVLWFKTELVAREIRALTNGQSVFFLNYRWTWDKEKRELPDLLQEIEDIISESGFMITIDSDNEKGLIIGTRGKIS